MVLQTRTSAGVGVQLAATVQRQFRLASRRPCSFCVEALLPVLFVLLFGWLGRLATNTTNPTQLFFPDPAAVPVPIATVHGAVRGSLCVGSMPSPDPSLSAALVALLPSCNCSAPVGVNPLGIPAAFCPGSGSGGSVGQFESFTNATAIPSLDMIALAHMIALQQFGPITGRFPQPQPRNALRASGKIYVAPDTQAARDLVNLLNTSGESLLFKPFLFGGYFPSQQQAFDFLKSEDGAGKAWALVTVNSFSRATGLDVSLSFNRSCIEWTNRVQNRFGGRAAKNYLTYFDSGFLSLEKLIFDSYLTFIGATADQFDVAGNGAAIVPTPYPEFRSNVFLTVAGLLLPLALCLAYLYAVSQVAKRLVEEKELRLREAMAAMGVSKGTIFVAWLVFLFSINIVTALLATIAMRVTFVKQSAPTLVFVIMLLFSMTTSVLGALLSCFFSKSRTAVIATPVLFFAFSIPSFAIQDPTPQMLRPLMFMSPTAFATAMKLVFNYEIDNGIGWNDLASPSDTPNLGSCIGMLLFDLILYTALTWYLDNVLAGEWGVRQHPCFCFLNCARLFSKKPAPPPQQDTALGGVGQGPRCLSGVSEPYPSTHGAPAVDFCAVTKSFGAGEDLRVAVNNFDLHVYPGMVTALLGHNGAGKTTLFNVLTGMLPPTSGDCYVVGASITNEREVARSHIGLCPQHNILWADLTCAEHLRYFAWVKGVPRSELDAVCDRMLREVDLFDKKEARSASLSGGQKRKLSVAIAFIGGSELVLLDEPTAGMDVHTRRHTWDLIQRMAREEKRTIVLTTHFMDEAELLGDRVAMMAAGELHCYGTPTFLKSRLGEGYTLAVQYAVPPTDETKAALLAEQVVSVIERARPKESRGREQFILLPMEQSANFPRLLRNLESPGVRNKYGIVSVSMTVATIEDVFVKIAHGDAGGDSHAAAGTAKLQVDLNAANVAAQTIANVRVEPPSFVRQLKGLMIKRFHCARRDRRAIVLQIVLPIVCITIAMALASLGPPDSPPALIDAHVLPNPQQAVIGGSCSAGFTSAVAQDLAVVSASNANTSYQIAQFLLAEYSSHGSAERPVAIQCTDATQPYYGGVPNFNTLVAPTMLFSNSTAYVHAAPYSVVTWYKARVRTAAAALGVSPAPRVSIYTAPLPFTDREQARLNGLSFAIMAIMIVVPFSFVPSTFTGFIVKERSSKAKLLQFVSGVGYGAYWTSNMLFDFLSFMVTEILAFIVFACFSRKEYVGSGEAFGATFLLITLYGAASIPTAYVMSLPFENHSAAQNAVLGIFFLAGFGLSLATYLIPLLNGPTWLAFIFRLFPSDCLGEALMNIANAPGKRQLGVQLSLLDMDQAGWPALYLAIIAVVATAVIVFVDHPERTKRQQMLSYRSTQNAPLPATEPADVAAERLEVEGPAGSDASRSVLRIVGLRKEYPAPAGMATSVNVAVQNLTYQVRRGEIFGLLGTNGAGKTTTMNVVTGECLPTMGHAFVSGHDVVSDSGLARAAIGYCPQFDAVHDLLTVEEHLHLYSHLRGVTNVDTIVDALVTAFGLAEYRRVKSKSLSGGNKRKLSVAIALVGGPSLLLLDEPTAGMDPVARRGMCDVVAAVKQHCAVVLTTHHLEEVEALADRAAIMVGGFMMCLGTLEHLKQQLGSGYRVSVRLEDDRKAEACVARLAAEYGAQCTLVEQHQTKLSFNIKQGGKATLANLFELLLRLKQPGAAAIPAPRPEQSGFDMLGPSIGAARVDLGVLDYTVSQSSVEEVFLAIAGGGVSNPGVSIPIGSPVVGIATTSSFHDTANEAQPFQPLLL